MKISIIVPVYNVERFLPRCLDSILNQTIREIEIILVDDGSTDHSGAVCDQYAAKDSRIIALHQSNSGVSAARNLGLAVAHGEYLGFIDSDDWIEPDMYERLLRNAEQYEAEISVCGMVSEGQSRTVIGTPGDIEILTGRQAQLKLMELITLLPSLCNKLYKRELLDALRNDSGVSFTEDMLANYRAFARSRRVVVDGAAGYHYMLREGSAVYAAVNQGHIDAITKAEEMLRSVQGDLELERLWRRRCVALRLTALNRIIKSEKMCEYFQPIRAALLRGKTEIFRSSIYTRREKAQTLAIWLALPIYKTLVRRTYQRQTGMGVESRAGKRNQGKTQRTA